MRASGGQQSNRKTTHSLRNPNGRLQSCIPCRAQKVSCDHGWPVCGRCKRRKKGSDCTYSTADSSSARGRQPEPPHTAASSSSAIVLEPFYPQSAGPFASSHKISPGYFGPLSSSAAYNQTKENLSLISGGHSEAGSQTETAANATTHDGFDSWLRAPALQKMALEALRQMPEAYEDMADEKHASRRVSGWYGVAVRRIVKSLRDHFDIYLRGERSDARLEPMARILCENTALPFRDDPDPDVWLNQFCGEALRWESIGLLWVFWAIGTGAMDRPEWNTIRDPTAIERAHAAQKCLACCIELAMQFSGGNIMVLYITFRRGTLDTVMTGDATLLTLNRRGEIMALLLFLGLHAIVARPSYQPNLCSEIKRGLFSSLFHGEKDSFSLVGLPPYLNRRYCSTPLPLDLPDELLVSGDTEAIAQATASLDEHGWNTTGNLYPVTLVRARTMLAYLRDELMENGLSATAWSTPEHMMDIKRRQHDLVANFPRGLLYEQDDFMRLLDQEVSPEEVFAKLLCHLEILQNSLLIERLAIRFGQQDTGELLSVSYECVAVTTLFWTHKDHMELFSRDFAWIAMNFGAPGGGVLCAELLNPTFEGTHHAYPHITRSGIIQRLVLLASFLDWVHPTAPNANLCSSCHSVIQRVLDHVLNAPAEVNMGIELMDEDFVSGLDFNFDLLDTFDWLKPT